MSTKKYSMLPYTEVDGIRTVSDSDIKDLFTRTTEDDLAKVVFYEGSISTPAQFLSMAKGKACCFYILMEDGSPIGYVWVNRFDGKGARLNFCFFRMAWGRTVPMGVFVVKTILGLKDKGGLFVFDLLTGLTPSWNKKAIGFAKKCGAKSLGEIPNAIYNNDTGRSEHAVFSYYTREGE